MVFSTICLAATLIARAANEKVVEDQFRSGPSPSLWTVKKNNSEFGVTSSELILTSNAAQTGFPEIETVKGALPQIGDWKLSVEFRIKSIGNYGSGLYLVQNDGRSAFRIHADKNIGAVLLGLDSLEVASGGAWQDVHKNFPLANIADWQRYEVRKLGQTLELSINDVLMVKCKAPTSELALRIGNNNDDLKAWDWTELGLRNVKIEYLNGPYPAWLTKALSIEMSSNATVFRSKKQSISRDRTSIAVGADTADEPGISLTHNGRVKISGRTASILSAPMSIVEFAPRNARQDQSFTRVSLFVNSKEVSTETAFPGRPLPIFTVETPESASVLTRVKVVGYDGKGIATELIRAEIRNVSEATAPKPQLLLAGDNIAIDGYSGESKGLEFFDSFGYLGSVKNPESFRVDARRLAPGQHVFWIVAKSVSGDLMPPVRSLIDIPSRYQVTSVYDNSVFKVEHETTNLPISIKRRAESTAVKTRIYMRGTMVAERDEPEFNLVVSMLDVPTGELLLEIVGVAGDGTFFAPEIKTFDVVSPFHDAMILRDSRAKTLAKLVRDMITFDQDVVYWYERARQEPSFRTFHIARTIYASDEFGRIASVGYIDSISMPGDAGRYLAECRAAIVRRAGNRYEIGMLQKSLGLKETAAANFHQVIAEVGEESGLGSLAVQELKSLKIDSSRVVSPLHQS